MKNSEGKVGYCRLPFPWGESTSEGGRDLGPEIRLYAIFSKKYFQKLELNHHSDSTPKVRIVPYLLSVTVTYHCCKDVVKSEYLQLVNSPLHLAGRSAFGMTIFT